jgi:hypothetical protein
VPETSAKQAHPGNLEKAASTTNQDAHFASSTWHPTMLCAARVSSAALLRPAAACLPSSPSYDFCCSCNLLGVPTPPGGRLCWCKHFLCGGFLQRASLPAKVSSLSAGRHSIFCRCGICSSLLLQPCAFATSAIPTSLSPVPRRAFCGWPLLTSLCMLMPFTCYTYEREV